ncbi:unnamed protein product [Brassica oleracea]
MLILSLGGSPRRRRSTLSVVLLKSKGGWIKRLEEGSSERGVRSNTC